MLSTLPLFYVAQSVNSDERRARFQGLRVIMKAIILLDCQQSLFFFRFSESNARARERRSRETRETRVAAREEKRESLFFRVSPVSRFARQTTQKRETARSLLFSLFLFKNHKDTFCLQVWQLKASHASPLPWKFLAFPTWKLQNWQTKFLVKVIWYLISQGRAQKFHTDDASLPRFG